MEISPLQKARYEYSPKLPGMLKDGVSKISVKEGEVTSSVADQEKIKALFPNTYGKKEITFENEWDWQSRGLYIGDCFYVVSSDCIYTIDLNTLENVGQTILSRG